MYLNVDLEIRSRADLMPLVRALAPHLFVLHAGRVDGMFFAAFETSGVRHSPDTAIRRLARALLKLPPSLQRLWKRARDRVFDIGVEKATGNAAFRLSLQRDTIKTVARLNARVVTTLYGRARRKPSGLPNKPLERAGTKRSKPSKRASAGRSAPSR